MITKVVSRGKWTHALDLDLWIKLDFDATTDKEIGLLGRHHTMVSLWTTGNELRTGLATMCRSSLIYSVTALIRHPADNSHSLHT